MLQQLNWMRINEIENKITDVLLRSGVYGEFVCHFVKLFALGTNLSVRKRIWLLKTEIEFLKMKLSERKWNRMPENEITCIFFEIDTGMLTSNQFRCEIERPFTNLNDISTKLAGKTYIIKTRAYYNIHKHKQISQHMLSYERLNILNSWQKKCYITRTWLRNNDEKNGL